MEYLRQAELYASDRGDLEEFKEIYVELRETCTIIDSVWKTLDYLYGAYIADTLEQAFVAYDEPSLEEAE